MPAAVTLTLDMLLNTGTVHSLPPAYGQSLFNLHFPSLKDTSFAAAPTLPLLPHGHTATRGLAGCALPACRRTTVCARRHALNAAFYMSFTVFSPAIQALIYYPACLRAFYRFSAAFRFALMPTLRTHPTLRTRDGYHATAYYRLGYGLCRTFLRPGLFLPHPSCGRSPSMISGFLPHALRTPPPPSTLPPVVGRFVLGSGPSLLPVAFSWTVPPLLLLPPHYYRRFHALLARRLPLVPRTPLL